MTTLESVEKARRIRHNIERRKEEAAEKLAKKQAVQAIFDSGDIIHDYIRERIKGETVIVGVILGTVMDNMIVTGWAKTNLKEGDVYDKGFGLGLALERAKGLVETPALPSQLWRQYRDFQVRCLRYFKQATVLSTEGPFVRPSIQNLDPYGLLDDLDSYMAPKPPTLEEELIKVMPPELRSMFEALGGFKGLEGIGIGIVC